MDEGVLLPPRRRFTVKERRRNAELEYCRNFWRVTSGLLLVHELKEHDPEMRWLAELFPLEEEQVSDEVAVQRLGEWCAAHPDDATALRYLAKAREDEALMRKAASMGDEWAMSKVCYLSSTNEGKFQMAWASAEKGGADGTCNLMRCFESGIGCVRNEIFAGELLERAADLGSFLSCYEYVERDEMNAAHRVKHLIGFFGLETSATNVICKDLQKILLKPSRDEDVVLFEVGEMFRGNIDFEKGTAFGKLVWSGHLEILSQVAVLHNRRCNVVREACVTWVLFAKRIGINKDVRRLIARMVWETRENPVVRVEVDDKETNGG